MPKKRYSHDDLGKARTMIKHGKVKEAEKILEWFYMNEPTFLAAKVDLAKVLVSTSAGTPEYIKQRRSRGVKLLDTIIADPNVSKRNLCNAKAIKARYLYERKYYFESYELYDELLDTDFYDEALVGIAKIESCLGDIYSAHNNFSEYSGRFSERATYEVARISIALGDDETFKKNLEALKNTSQRDKALLQEVYYEIKNKNYQKAYDLFQKFISKLHYLSIEYERILLFLRNKVGLDDSIKVDRNLVHNVQENDYLLCQFREFNEYIAKKYIVSSFNFENPKSSKEYCFEDMEKIYNVIKKCIENAEPFRCELLDYYVVAMPTDIGIIRGIMPTNMIKVGTITGTKNIVTMKPIESLNYIREAAEKKRGNGRTHKK